MALSIRDFSEASLAPAQTAHKKKFDLYSEDNFPKVSEHMKSLHNWCRKGQITAFPVSFKLFHEKSFCLESEGKYEAGKKLTLSKEFLASYLGQAYQKCEDEFVNRILDPKKRDKHVRKIRETIEISFENGTCYGQIAAVMIQIVPQFAPKTARQSGKEVILHANPMQLIFFQAMQNLRYLYKSMAKKSSSQEAIQALFEKNRDLETMHLELLADVQFIFKRTVSASNLSFEGKLLEKVKMALQEEVVALRVTFEKENVSVHAISLFFGPKFYIFDSLAGLVEYKSQKELIDALIIYCKELLSHQENRLKKVYLEGFKKSCYELVHGLLNIAGSDMNKIPQQIRSSLQARLTHMYRN